MASARPGAEATARPRRRGRGRPAKFSRPDDAPLVKRPRLMVLLSDAHPVTWVFGPAGAGKTSMLSAWCASRRRPVLWYRVDEQDRDPRAVFASLADCLGASRAAARRRLPVFGPEHLRDIPHFARRFARSFNAGLPADALLVFDDCHASGLDGAFHPILAALLDERREDVAVLSASRAAPLPALLPSLAAPGARVIGWDELRCDDEEARALCRHVTGREPGLEQLRLADGWPAGLVLLLHSRDSRARVGADAADAATRVFEALAAPAFEALPSAQRALLLATAHASRVTPSLAERCGVGHAAKPLADLWRAHFFVEKRTATGCSESQNSPCITCLAGFRSQNSPTDSSDEPEFQTPSQDPAGGSKRQAQGAARRVSALSDAPGRERSRAASGRGSRSWTRPRARA
jgi:LuxR family maltose regulon positive regulatory protein